MRCAFHPDRQAVAQCAHCNENLCRQCAIPEEGGVFSCSRCAALKAARDAAEGIGQQREVKRNRRQERETKKTQKKKLWAVLMWVILLACAAVIALQVPAMFSSFEEERPLRRGSYETDAQTDQCIRNLWQAAGLLQEGKAPGEELVCPASKRPYGVTSEGGDAVARCPDPGQHGFKEMRASKNRPVPELIK